MSQSAEPQPALTAVREGEERWRIICELISDFAYSARVEADGMLVSEWVTDAFTRVTGYTSEELSNRAAWERLFHPDDAGTVLHHLETLLAGESHVCEYRIVTKGGDIRWVCDHGQPVWNESKSRVVRIYGAAHDITKRKHAELERDVTLKALRVSERIFRSTFEAIPDAALLWCREPDGRITLAQHNAAATVLSRGRIADLVDMEVDRFFEHSPDVAARIRRTLETGEAKRTEVFYRLQTTGEQKWLLADYVQATEDCVLNIIQDITAQKEAAQRLQQHAVKLQARNQELDAFAYSVAHDIRQPLTLMINFADLLTERLPDLPPEKALQYLRAIVRNGRKMNDIVEELLLLARVPRSEVKMAPLDMASIVAQAQKRLRDMIEAHQADIVLPTAWPIAWGYAPWVEEVWVNYISNAIQHGGVPPRVELGSSLPNEGVIRFWVRDNGPGLAPEDQARLFAPFTQLDAERTTGHGLGLAIVRRIVEKLGGTVGMESNGEAGHGCVFWFTLPDSERTL